MIVCVCVCVCVCERDVGDEWRRVVVVSIASDELIGPSPTIVSRCPHDVPREPTFHPSPFGRLPLSRKLPSRFRVRVRLLWIELVLGFKVMVIMPPPKGGIMQCCDPFVCLSICLSAPCS